ncbi:putative leucine-rich repeat receptor-like protein kinase [Panicum miliaceum]|uniref:Leucine-rich repeat receptor-like protein kinase n=1 Tax=Panicum miliaceum TaxID=4540 RepID=A0A3L6SSY5_PANMI|nr:putative leucine-rich repeat receptor-like protein kinase [Panicum miliaceum]
MRCRSRRQNLPSVLVLPTACKWAHAGRGGATPRALLPRTPINQSLTHLAGAPSTPHSRSAVTATYAYAPSADPLHAPAVLAPSSCPRLKRCKKFAMAASRVLLLVLALLDAGCAASASAPAPSPDATALLAFKSVCSDPAAALGSWAESSDPCDGAWRGVRCQRPSPSPSSPPPRVRRVVLEGLRLGGHAAALELLADLPALSSLSLKNNTFTGALHGVDFSRLAPHLKLLYLSGNGFSGRFPDSVLRLRHLRRLDLSGNRLAGTIPPEIGHRLRALLTLDLARNSFAGPVPVSLEAVPKLAELNVSGNHFVGPIPGRLAAAFPSSSFAGNPGLCGAPLAHRCNGPQQIVYSNVSGEASDGSRAARGKIHDRWMVVMIMSAVGAAVASLVAAALCAVLLLKNRKPARRPRARSASANSTVAREETVRFDGCCVEFDVATLMQGAAEMLGKGATATTYRVVMRGHTDTSDDAGVEEAQGEVVVVKRMRRREGASREDERRRRELAREMGTWRHPNIVGLRAFYASAEELLLVFDYIPNGSLHSLLHENRGPARVPLDWQTRLKLAQDAAHGLAYLHGVSGGKLSHRHLTSSNILVDGSGTARVSDFALLQLLSSAPPPGDYSSLQKQDVHGFGVVLLELLTGRQPLAEDSGAQDLPRWARAVVREEWTSEVFDVELLRGRGAEDEMVALLQVALLCVAEEPGERPRMAVVAKMIEDIRDRGSKRSNKFSASPSQAGHSYGSSPCVSEDTTRSTPASSS